MSFVLSSFPDYFFSCPDTFLDYNFGEIRWSCLNNCFEEILNMVVVFVN